MYAPPWIHTSTGRETAPAGAHTLSVRTSSSPGDHDGDPGSSADCGATGPKRVQSRTPVQGSTGCGSRNRAAPKGGAAYGIPSTATTSSPTGRPRTDPSFVRNTTMET